MFEVSSNKSHCDDTQLPNTIFSGTAPSFSVKGVVGGDISDIRVTDYSGKYLIIVFYTEDFACYDGIGAFNDSIEKFKNLKCEVVACSTDSPQGHKSWIKAPK